MGRKNIIIQIGDLDLDHDQEYFEEHLHTKNEIEEVKNELVKSFIQVEEVKNELELVKSFIQVEEVDNELTQIANPIEKIDNESIFQQDLIEEQIVTVEKPTKNSKKKNTNQESSS